jgi:hypothetical protein
MHVAQGAAKIWLSGLSIFGIAAALIAVGMHLVGSENPDRLAVRLTVEFPLLLVVAGIALLPVVLAAAGAAAMTDSRTAAACAALVCGWAIAGGSPSLAGLGYHAIIQHAFAVAAALPWLLHGR